MRAILVKFSMDGEHQLNHEQNLCGELSKFFCKFCIFFIPNAISILNKTKQQ